MHQQPLWTGFRTVQENALCSSGPIPLDMQMHEFDFNFLTSFRFSCHELIFFGHPTALVVTSSSGPVPEASWIRDLRLGQRGRSSTPSTRRSSPAQHSPSMRGLVFLVRKSVCHQVTAGPCRKYWTIGTFSSSASWLR